MVLFTGTLTAGAIIALAGVILFFINPLLGGIILAAAFLLIGIPLFGIVYFIITNGQLIAIIVGVVIAAFLVKKFIAK